MTDTKFTPGPLAVSLAEGLPSPGVYNPSPYEVTAKDGKVLVAGIICNEANAHLIAAAPELYAALEKLLAYLPPSHPARSGGLQALAKARGEL